MQNQSYKLSRLAQSHLLNVKSYTIEHFSEIQWHQYRASLISGLQTLANNPRLGKSCGDIYQNGFYFPIAKHTVYYVIKNDFILIVAILGRFQLPQNHL